MANAIHMEEGLAARTGRRRFVRSSVLASIVMAAALSLATVAPVLAAPAALSLQGPSCNYTIKSGQYSGCVTQLQLELNKLGYGLVVDGSFGPKTLAAVKAFQRSRGLAVDGLVGPLTKAALRAAVTPAPTPPPATPNTGAGTGAAAGAAAAAAARRAASVAVASNEIGTLYGSARQQSYWTAVGDNDGSTSAWCATFVSWVSSQTGATSFRSASVLAWVNAAKNGTGGLSVTTSPQPGDYVAFDWENDNNFTGTQHIAVFQQWNVGTSFTSIEGNTHPDSASTPTGVWARTRSSASSYTVLFIHVSY